MRNSIYMRSWILMIIIFVSHQFLNAQTYHLNGSATNYSTDCYRITPSSSNKNGTVWYSDQIDLTEPFTIECNMFFGNKDADGADGMTFCIQNVGPNAIGINGNGMGFGSFSPSFGVEFDTYDNQWGTPTNGDIATDHIAFQINGNTNHLLSQNIAGPVSATSTNLNIEDNTTHFVRFTWDPVTLLFEVYFDCELRLSTNYDVINNVFSGNPNVYWGYTAGTGGYFNEHRVCVEKNILTVPDQLEICEGETVSLDATGAGISGNYSWTPNYNISSTTDQSPDVWPTVTTTYYVTYNTPCGFPKTDSILVTVNPTPIQEFPANQTVCPGGSFLLDAGNPGCTYAWSNSATSQTQNITSPGNYTVTITSPSGCSNTDQFTLSNYTAPIANAGTDITICTGASATLTATGGNNYTWNTGDLTQNITVTPISNTTYTVTVTDANGCTASDNVNVTIGSAISFSLGNDQNICQGNSVTLSAPAGYNYLWSTGETSQQITKIPSSTTNYVVTVSDNFGCSGSDDVVVNVNSNPILTLSPTNPTICSGASINIVANGGSAYTWSNGNNTNSINVNPSNTTTYNVTTTNTSGCSATSSVTVTVTPGITVQISPSVTICPGTQTELWASGGNTYIWSDGQTGSNIFVAPLVPTTYTVTVSDNQGCTGTATTSIQVDNAINIDLGADQQICKGQPITLTAPSGFSTYQWSTGSNNISITETPQNTQTYSVSVSTGSGCYGVDNVTVTVLDLPIANAGADVTVCNQNPVFLSAYGGTTYLWSNGLNNQTIQVNPTYSQTFTVTVTDINGCTSSDNVNVSVFPLLHLDLITSNDSVCPGDTINISAEIHGGMGAPYIVYDGNHQVITFPVMFTTQSDTTLTFTLIDQCNSPIIVQKQFKTYPIPSINFTSNISSGCVPLKVNFNEQNPDVSGQMYLWDFHNSGNLSYQKNPTHTFRNAGNYDITLTVTSPRGCKNTKTITNMIQAYPVPESRYNTEPAIVTIIKPIVDFNNLSQGANYYVWHFGDGDSASHFNTWHQYPSIGDYNTSLIATNTYGCADTSYLKVSVIEQASYYAPSAFSPDNNGINDNFYITGNAIIAKDFYLTIYDRWGLKIWETKKYYPELSKSEPWDGTQNGKKLPYGTYVWFVEYYDFTNVKHQESGHITIVR